MIFSGADQAAAERRAGAAGPEAENAMSPYEAIDKQVQQAHLRRSAQDNVARQGLVFGELAIDLAAKQVRKQGKVLLLSATEFRLLSLLVSHPGRIYSAEQLSELIWQADGLDDARTVAVHISNLRKKIEADPARPQYIVTHRGLGYQFSDGWRLVR